MKKKILILMLLIVGSSVLASEQIPVRIVPAEPISTVHDEVQLGDNIMFKVQNDVYLNDKLIFTKDALVFGTVDKIEDNGWANDNAEIRVEKFKLRNAKNEIVTIKSSVKIDGFELLKTKENRFAQFFNYIGVIFRGKEIDIKYPKEMPIFTIWYDL
ncbi:hypothetical protein EGQ24_02040 [bacterium]|nr:hypothetical protein [bacterium]